MKIKKLKCRNCGQVIVTEFDLSNEIYDWAMNIVDKEIKCCSKPFYLWEIN